MPLFDWPLEQLRTYQAPAPAPPDFDAFWQRTLGETRKHALGARFERVDEPLYCLTHVFDVTFAGFGGQPIRAWLVTPAGATTRLPTVVSYVGYGGGRSLPLEHMAPAVAGLAHFVMDNRGQGSGFSPGDTADEAGSGPQHPGFMTRGIESPDTYYYRRLITDAVRAVEAAVTHPLVDAERVAVRGASQGGGLALAAAGLLGERVKLVAADVPFLCHFRRAVELGLQAPYNEITRYLAVHRGQIQAVFATLAYFDGMFFSERIKARALVSCGLMDQVCPPSTVFAAYNRITAPKEMKLYDFNEHEGGGIYQQREWLRWFVECL